MTIFIIFLSIFILFGLYFDFINGKEAFGKRKRRINFVISALAWYGFSIFFLFLSILYPEALIWQYSFGVGFLFYLYFIIHTFRGLIIYNCSKQEIEQRKKE